MSRRSTSRTQARTARWSAGAAGVGCLLALAVSVADLRSQLRARPTTIDEIVGSAAVLSVSAVLVWASATLVLTALTAVPGLLGSTAARAAGALTPRVVRRLVTVAVGVTVAGGASPALGAPMGPTPAGPADALATDTDLGGDALPSLDRPAPPYVITVRPGDCLWRIAAAHLAPGASAADIAAAWPRWYDENRGVIGADPDLIRPGQRLTQPS